MEELRKVLQNLPKDDYAALLSAFNSGDSYMVKLARNRFVAVNTPPYGYGIIVQHNNWLYGYIKKG